MSLATQSKKLPILGAVFAVQLVIAAVLMVGDQEQVSSINEPLLVFERENIDQIVLAGKEGEPLTLNKEGEQWYMADKLPVLPLRLDSIFESLAKLKTQWPVANTDKAAQRFEVQDDNFAHKVTLFDGDKQAAEVLIGSSPSFNKSHVRIPGEDDIYSLRINAYDTTNNIDHWLESTLLQPQGELLEVKSDSYALAKEDGKWPEIKADEAEKAEGEAEQEKAGDASEVLDIAKFEEVLTTLRVIGVADSIAEFDAPETQDAQADGNEVKVIKWSVKTADDEYQYKMLKKADQFYLQRDDYPQTFRISKYQYDNFAKIHSDSLSVAKN